MILLDAFSPESDQLFVHDALVDGRGAGRSTEQIQALLARLGYGAAVLVDESFDGLGIDHRWALYDHQIHYTVRVPVLPRHMNELGRYICAALALSGLEDDAGLVQARLAVHELAINVLEHGRPLRSDSTLHMRLSFTENTLCAILQDECYPFNPLGRAPVDYDSKVELRAKRGYGVQVARRLLDDINYSYNGQGNELIVSKHFSQRVEVSP